MKTPKQKAEYLIRKFTNEVTILGCGKTEGNPCVVSDVLSRRDARKQALICVEEIMNDEMYIDSVYWNEVKSHLIK